MKLFTDMFRKLPLAWATPAAIEALDRTPIGLALAEDVYAALAAGPMLNTHRDYCGQGLVLRDGKVDLVNVYEGSPGGSPVLSWPDRWAFVAWLSVQSDYSLSGADEGVPGLFTTSLWHRNNQRIGRGRLAAFVSEPS